MATIRKNQARLSRAEWAAFVDAVNAIQARGAKRPNYRDFVDVHVRAMGAEGHEWGVHSMPGMLGRNFLAWHRHYLVQVERRLQDVAPDVSIPYWNWLADPRSRRRSTVRRRCAGGECGAGGRRSSCRAGPTSRSRAF